MKPETVLHIKPGEKPEDVCTSWLAEYRALKEKYPDKESLIEQLCTRARLACELLISGESGDNELLDGSFPLGNEEDAVFAGGYFTTDALACIQLSCFDDVECGYYTEYNYAVLVRLGFLAEMRGDMREAARCYEGVSGSQTVQNRELNCRRKAENGEPKK